MLDSAPRLALARCGHLLSRVDGANLDCVSDDLALLLAARGVTDTLSPFGRDWRFDLTGPVGGFAGPDLPPAAQDEMLARRTGWRPRWSPVTETSIEDWWRTLRRQTALVVVGDAYHLPWLPYAGHAHMTHGFVLEGLDVESGRTLVHIVDPYDNVTEWGRAAPLCTTIPLDHLLLAVDGGRWGVLERAGRAEDAASPTDVIAANCRAIASSTAAYEAFVGQYQTLDLAALEHLALQTWLLVRNRVLHGRWLAAYDEAAARLFAPVPEAWQRASESAYLALRRVKRGRAVPFGAMQALRHAVDLELAVATQMLDSESRTPC